MNSTLFTMVKNYNNAESLVHALIFMGVTTNDISLLCKDYRANSRLDNELGFESSISGLGVASDCCTFDWLDELGIMRIPDNGEYVAAGPVFKYLGGTIIGDKWGRLLYCLVESGVAEEDACIVINDLEGESVLVAVSLTDEEKLQFVNDIFAKCSAKNVKAFPQDVSEN